MRDLAVALKAGGYKFSRTHIFVWRTPFVSLTSTKGTYVYRRQLFNIKPVRATLVLQYSEVEVPDRGVGTLAPFLAADAAG